MDSVIDKNVLIPLKDKVEILNTLYALAKRGNNEAHRRLFDIHKQYIAYEPDKSGWDCEGCRLRAWREMQLIVNHWKQESCTSKRKK